MSMKSAVKEHISNFPITEHFKKHGFLLNGTCDEQFTVYKDGMELRKFSRQDLKNCAELYKEVFSNHPWNDGWMKRSQVMNYLNELISNPVFMGYVIYQNSEMVAACLGHSRSWWSGKEFFIDEFFVAAKFQGMGIGALLLEYVENLPEMRDFNGLNLSTDKTVPAKNFYLKNGFKTRNNRVTMIKKFY